MTNVVTNVVKNLDFVIPQRSRYRESRIATGSARRGHSPVRWTALVNRLPLGVGFYAAAARFGGRRLRCRARATELIMKA